MEQLTSLLTELVSHNAVAVTSIAISLAEALGVDVRPLVVPASASFATPIGYQTNMMVYGPSGVNLQILLKLDCH